MNEIHVIISKLKQIVNEASKHLNQDARQELQDDIGFYIIKELEKLK